MAENDDIAVVETPVEELLRAEQSRPTNVLGDDAPEGFRGKSVNEVFDHVQKMQNTLKINEELIRRLSSEPPKPQVVHVQSQPSAPVAPVQQGPTEDQMLEMINSDDPKVRLQAWQIMQQRNNQVLGEFLERRLAPLSQGTIGAAEAQARQKYAIEFELFPDLISSYMQRAPAETWANPQSWEELMRQVRGHDPMRYVNELQKRAGTRSIESIQASEASNVGFVPPVRAGGSNGAPGGAGTLDALQRKIAEEWNMSESEYLHFDRQGNQL